MNPPWYLGHYHLPLAFLLVAAIALRMVNRGMLPRPLLAWLKGQSDVEEPWKEKVFPEGVVSLNIDGADYGRNEYSFGFPIAFGRNAIHLFPRSNFPLPSPWSEDQAPLSVPYRQIQPTADPAVFQLGEAPFTLLTLDGKAIPLMHARLTADA